MCGSGVTEDACGVCGGDNSTCWGCKDPKACNYNSKAIVDSKRCVYHYDNNPNYDCDFKCIAPRDCAGVCAGTAKVDACGVCKGDGQSCTTCTDEKACNYEPSNHSDPNLCHYPPDNIHNCHGVCTKVVFVLLMQLTNTGGGMLVFTLSLPLSLSRLTAMHYPHACLGG